MWWKLKHREQVTIHQAKPLVLRRENDHWVVVGEVKNNAKKDFSASDEIEEQIGFH